MERNIIILDIETLGLNPMQDKIISIGLFFPAINETSVFAGDNETNLLESFWSTIAANKDSAIVTFGGDAFDIPFLIKRSLVNNIKITKWFGKSQLVDLRKVVNSFHIAYDKFALGTLRDWACKLGITCDTHDGKKMPELYLADDWDGIASHNKEDLKITTALYQRCIDCGLILEDLRD